MMGLVSSRHRVLTVCSAVLALLAAPEGRLPVNSVGVDGQPLPRGSGLTQLVAC